MLNEAGELELHAAFDEQARRIVREQDCFKKDSSKLLVGLEGEVALHDPKLTLDQFEKVRDTIITATSGVGYQELGAAQIEFKTIPVNLAVKDGFRSIEEIYRGAYHRVLSATHHYCSLLRIGAHPFLSTTNPPRTNQQKYIEVPDWYTKRNINRIDASIVSLFQAFQINVQAHSAHDAVDKLNRSFMIGPYLLALAGNTRYIECRDMQIRDIRLALWQKAFFIGGRCRVGLPNYYFPGFSNYLDYVGTFPFIFESDLDKVLQTAIGMAYFDSRIKVYGETLVVELRILPTQPTIEEELLLMLLYLGRLYYSQLHQEPLMPLRMVRENRSYVMDRMNLPLWTLSDTSQYEFVPFHEAVRREVKRSKEGLEHLGLAAYLDEGLLSRMLQKGTPSDRLADALQQNQHPTQEEMEEALRKTNMLI